MFTDIVNIFIKSGNGGNGCVSFHREKYVASGGPDGGDGGRGGDIIFVAVRNVNTLMDFRYSKKFAAKNGEDGKGGRMSGKDGQSLYIKVPVGTVVIDKASGKVIKDFNTDNEEFVMAKGGSGGFGNARFATATRQAPQFARSGMPGIERDIILELKLIADVGLLGFPNVGKSTFLSVVSDAKPKIANYHFTTLSPNLGVVKMNDGAFVIADIPGIIEGANEGIGLGHEFLRHVERTRILIHMVDASGIEGRNPINDFDTINNELELYSEKLRNKHQIIAATKSDITEFDENYKIFEKELKNRGYDVFPISSATKDGISDLLNHVYQKLSDIPYEEIEENYIESNLDNIKDMDIKLEVIDGVFFISGERIRRLAGSVNFNDYESMQYFQRTLRTMGVISMLEEHGISIGDTVNIYDFEFEYEL